MFIATAFCLLAVFQLLGDILPAVFLWSWIVAQVVLTGIRWRAQQHWKHVVTDVHNIDERSSTATMHAFISGVLWGVLGYAAVTADSALPGLATVMLLTGLVAGATAIISHLTTMYLVYVVPMLLPAAVRFYSLRDIPELSWSSYLIVGYLLISIIVARACGASVRQSIALRLENRDLLDSMRVANDRTRSALQRETYANEAKSRFLAAASHDLRQPLHSLRLLGATLSDQTHGGRHEPLANLINRSVESMGGLFDAILDISELDSGTLKPSIGVVDVHRMGNRLADEFRPIAEEKGLEFRLTLASLYLRTDAVLIERLLRNLLSNAVRYTDSGYVHLEVTAIAEGSHARIYVSDTGPGIAVEDRQRVFEEFVQLGNEERDRSQGIGLGLSIVRRIATLLNLSLTFDTHDDGGLSVSIDIDTTVEGSVGMSGDRCGMTSRTLTMSSQTALVIDDDEEVRAAIEVFLESRGMLVIAVPSVESGIEVLDEAECQPDILIVDYRLGNGIRGTDAVNTIASHLGHTVPAILITGEVGADRLTDIQRSGLAVLHKPCVPDELVGLIRQLVRD